MKYQNNIYDINPKKVKKYTIKMVTKLVTNKRKISSFSEKEIEDILYENYWIINPNLVIPEIEGSISKGRQVIIEGQGNTRRIDLLFKDITHGRPLIVELKSCSIKREHIGQLLEYKSWFLNLNEEQKCEFENNFEDKYLIPKLMIIGYEIHPQVQLMANMVGIDVKIFGKEIEKLNIDLDNLNSRLKTFKKLIDEKKDFIARYEFVDKFNEDLIEVAEKINKNLKVSESEYNDNYINEPIFIDQYVEYEKPFREKGKKKKTFDICGFYEYDLDSDLFFDENFIYVDLCIDTQI